MLWLGILCILLYVVALKMSVSNQLPFAVEVIELGFMAILILMQHCLWKKGLNPFPRESLINRLPLPSIILLFYIISLLGVMVLAFGILEGLISVGFILPVLLVILSAAYYAFWFAFYW